MALAPLLGRSKFDVELLVGVSFGKTEDVVGAIRDLVAGVDVEVVMGVVNEVVVGVVSNVVVGVFIEEVVIVVIEVVVELVVGVKGSTPSTGFNSRPVPLLHEV